MGNCKISKPCDGKTEETNIFNLSDEFDVEKIEQLGIDGISLEEQLKYYDTNPNLGLRMGKAPDGISVNIIQEESKRIKFKSVQSFSKITSPISAPDMEIKKGEFGEEINGLLDYPMGTPSFKQIGLNHKILKNHQSIDVPSSLDGGLMNSVNSISKKGSLTHVGNNSPQVSVGIKNFISGGNQNVGEVYTKLKKIYSGVNKIDKVIHNTTGEIRIIKTIPQNSLKKTENPRIEFSILKNLDHPNIIRVYEYYQDDYNFYVVTEYCNGGSLSEKVIRNTCLTENVAAKIIEQVLVGLVYCHTRNIMHRDIKMENILFLTTLAQSSIKIIDFGLSTVAKESKRRGKAGTMLYMAPEVAQNIQYSEKCDLWSVGVLTYIMLTGKSPYHISNTKDTIWAIRHGKYSFSKKHFNRISYQGRDFIEGLMKYDPEVRLSAKQGLDHPWIKTRTIPNKQDDLIRQAKSCFKTMFAFRVESPIQQAFLSYIRSQMSENPEEARLKKIFEFIDQDKDGTLAKSDLEYCLTTYLNHTKKEATIKSEKIISNLDLNNTGLIEYSEFIMCTMSKQDILCEENLIEAFTALKSEETGLINHQSLQNIFGNNISLDRFFTDRDYYEEFPEINLKDKINYEDFKVIIKKMLIPTSPIPPCSISRPGTILSKDESFTSITNDYFKN